MFILQTYFLMFTKNSCIEAVQNGLIHKRQRITIHQLSAITSQAAQIDKPYLDRLGWVLFHPS